MRTLLVAGLIVSTALLHAQTASNARTGVLDARAANPAPLPTADSTALESRRITTGVTAPKLISASPIKVATSDLPSRSAGDHQVVVSFTVNAFGVPTHVKLLKSVNPTVDARVIAAVGGYRYEPAKLDTWNVPMELNLVVKFETK